jgi:hypothetical protein
LLTEEKEGIKRDYEDLLRQVREEYARVTLELKAEVEIKNASVEELKTKLQEAQD